MNFKNLPASILLAISGIITLVASLPLVSDFFPIAIFSVNNSSGQLTFFATRLPNRVTVTQIGGWTFFGLAGYEVAIFFMGVGALGLFFALNTYFNFIPLDKIKNIPINAIASIVIGIGDIAFLLLIYISPTSNVGGFGLSSLASFSLKGAPTDWYYPSGVIGASLGLGFFLLILGALLLIIAGIINFFLQSSPSKASTA